MNIFFHLFDSHDWRNVYKYVCKYNQFLIRTPKTMSAGCLWTLLIVHVLLMNVRVHTTTTTTTTTFVADDHRIVEEIRMNNGKLKECFVYDKRFYTQTDSARINLVDSGKLDELVRVCHESQTQHDVILQSYVKNRQKRAFFIYPGTKWCGPGNIADHDQDLGYHTETDRCCQVHDHCNDTIVGWGRKHGLWNPTPIYRSHCRCDNRFYRCLKNCTEAAAQSVGKIYFNLLSVLCMIQEHPTVCVKKGWFWGCKKKSLDLSQPKIWKFKDNKSF